MKETYIFLPILNTLKHGGVGVLPTDTIYGIVGSALNKKTVARIYELRRRNPKKPMIILIADMRDIARFGISLDAKTKKILKRIWPGKVSVILPCKGKQWRYLHRGTKQLAFRIPQLPWLREFLAKTGPLVAPSANFEGETPARTVRAAKRYFKDTIDFYMNKGTSDSMPSTLVSLRDGKLAVLRKGAVRIKESI